jgi:hypothetical protein
MKVNLEKRCSVKKRLKMEVNRRTDNIMVKRKITQNWRGALMDVIVW